MRHELKTWPKFFDMVRRGCKMFEVRIDDRGYQEGDTLLLKEYDPNTEKYTGRALTCDVTCIVSGAEFGIKPGCVAMGIKLTGSHNASRTQVSCISALAEKIEGMLHDKGAFREVLPMHLDQHKFRWMVRHDIERVITDHMQANVLVRRGSPSPQVVGSAGGDE
jgi:hypothetical protein